MKSKLRKILEYLLIEETAMWNIYVYRNGAWAKGNRNPLTRTRVEKLKQQFEKTPNIQRIEIIHIKDAERLEKRKYFIDPTSEKDYYIVNKKM